MRREENDYIVAFRWNKLGQLLAYALSKSLHQQRMSAPAIDNAPLNVGGKGTADRKLM